MNLKQITSQFAVVLMFVMIFFASALCDSRNLLSGYSLELYKRDGVILNHFV